VKVRSIRLFIGYESAAVDSYNCDRVRGAFDSIFSNGSVPGEVIGPKARNRAGHKISARTISYSLPMKSVEERSEIRHYGVDYSAETAHSKIVLLFGRSWIIFW
jgi:hypothetical protein